MLLTKKNRDIPSVSYADDVDDYSTALFITMHRALRCTWCESLVECLCMWVFWLICAGLLRTLSRFQCSSCLQNLFGVVVDSVGGGGGWFGLGGQRFAADF